MATPTQITYSLAHAQLKSLMDRAAEDREVIVVRRPTGGDVALIAADELASLLETAHLMRSPRNAQRLLAALSRAHSASGPSCAIHSTASASPNL